MSDFQNVAVQKKANVYFAGQVSSRTVRFADGSEKTLGIMLPGEYEFGTEKPELMEIQSGSLQWSLAGQDSWVEVGPGQSFNVPGESRFTVRVTEICDYICSFLD